MSAFTEFGSDAETRQVTSGDVRMRVVIQGRRQVLVFIPGGDSPAEARANGVNRAGFPGGCLA